MRRLVHVLMDQLMFSGSERRYLAVALVVAGAALVWAVRIEAALAPMADESLAEITGQDGSLFLSDHTGPNELTGAPADGSANFDFYRMGLDVKSKLNANSATFQPGRRRVNHP